MRASSRSTAMRAAGIGEHARLGRVDLGERLPGAPLGVERLEREQRLEVRRLALEHGFEGRDGARRLVELVAVDLAGAEQRRDRQARIARRLRFLLELLDQPLVIARVA